MRDSEFLSLADLVAESGVSIPCAGHLPLDMGDPQFVWFIDKGAVDLFLVEQRDDVEPSALQHLLRATSGRLLPGVAPQSGSNTFSLMAKGRPGTLLQRLSMASLARVRSEELAGQVDAWLMDVSAMLSRGVRPRPRPDRLLEPEEAPLTKSGTLSTHRGVVWVSELPRGVGLFMDLIDPTESEDKKTKVSAAIPLSPLSWLTLMEPVPLSTRSSKALAEEGLLWPCPGPFSFHGLFFGATSPPLGGCGSNQLGAGQSHESPYG